MNQTEEVQSNNRKQKYSPIVRAKPEDVKDLRLHLRAIKEGFSGSAPSLEEIDSVTDMIARNDGAVAGIARENGKIVASIGLTVNRLWYSDEFLLADAWHYVVPTRRRSPYAKALIRFAKTYADTAGVPLVMTIENTPALAPKIGLYTRELEAYGGLFRAAPGAQPDLPEGVHLATTAIWDDLERVSRWIGADNSILPVNYPRALAEIQQDVLRQGQATGRAVVGVVGQPGNIKGMIILGVQVEDVTGKCSLVERFIAVPEGQDTYGASDKLMRFAQWASTTLNLPLDIGVSSRKKPEAKIRLYRRRFGEPRKLFFFHKG